MQNKTIKSILLIISLFLITSCTKNSSMKPEDFKNKEPRLIIENYLSGNVKARISAQRSRDQPAPSTDPTTYQ